MNNEEVISVYVEEASSKGGFPLHVWVGVGGNDTFTTRVHVLICFVELYALCSRKSKYEAVSSPLFLNVIEISLVLSHPSLIPAVSQIFQISISNRQKRRKQFLTGSFGAPQCMTEQFNLN